ncbi:Kiwa anti-phage protein KwaB-like domain-containing protein [Photobacterium leiognathi]|uniref:Kiwa anti-phage protein KwaB-like domain-containing protein n=1 Tax=Photobacterium leiognathi TaxID=553611 RepID=UPI00076A082F|nr:Kiwa anti-phage protein KwaB-like domain-containing protein [Photobacterium leiognathi]
MVSQNFFALIKDETGKSDVKRIRVKGALQTSLVDLFDKQLVCFNDGVDTEIVFNGDWKPDSNELLVLNDVEEAKIMVDAINANASSFHDLQLSKFSSEPIKAIFTGFKENEEVTVLVQKFSSRQALSLSQIPIIKMQKGNIFVHATEDIFTLDNKLVAIIIGNKTKFKSFHNARMVFNLTNYYQEATDADLKAICRHPSLEVEDDDSFIENADSQVRKMVHTISSTSLLDNYSVIDIQSAAESFPNVPVKVNQGKLVLPTDKRELKEVLHFLLEDIYKGPLSGSNYLTNSKRKY